jgi:uncharacterized protein
MFLEKFVSWKGLNERISLENCHIIQNSTGITVRSNITGIHEKIAFNCSYNFLISEDWNIQQFEVNLLMNDQRTTLLMLKNESGKWLQKGRERSDLVGCIDIDLTVTPFTNTLPVNRLSIPVGDRKEISVVYIDLLENDIYRAEQVYTRLSEDAYLFEMASVDFSAEIIINEKSGLVVDYPPLFTRV